MMQDDTQELLVDALEQSDEDIQELIVDALEQSDYEWRTAAGIAMETHVELEQIRNLLEISPTILRSRIPNKAGKPLYTTRKKYKSRSSIAKRLLAAIRNEAT